MVTIHYITPDFAVAPQLEAEDFGALARRRFRTIIDNRPDDEPGVSVASGEARALAGRLGLVFRYLPVSCCDVLERKVIACSAEALAGLPRPILAYCKSGTRSAMLWALASVRWSPLDVVMRQLRAAGFEDLAEVITDDLAAEAARFTPGRRAAA